MVVDVGVWLLLGDLLEGDDGTQLFFELVALVDVR
jgi:hypothetical protein